jgi:hypothetical protein
MIVLWFVRLKRFLPYVGLVLATFFTLVVGLILTRVLPLRFQVPRHPMN